VANPHGPQGLEQIAAAALPIVKQGSPPRIRTARAGQSNCRYRLWRNSTRGLPLYPGQERRRSAPENLQRQLSNGM
jgi:hypothetical protein